MRKWTLGPRFSAYLSLNFKLMQGIYGLVLLYCLMYGALYAGSAYQNLLQFLYLFIAMALGPLLAYVPRLFRESISDDSAMLYASIPVSAFETVMAKAIAVAMSIWISLIITGCMLLTAFHVSDEKWQIFTSCMWNLGFTPQNLLSGLLLIIWCIAVLALSVGSTALLGWMFASRIFRGKKIMMWACYILLTAAMLALLAGMLWMIWRAAFLPVLVRVLIIMVVAIGLAVLLIRTNVMILEKWYSI